MHSVQTPSFSQTFQDITAAIAAADRDRALLLAANAWKAGDAQPLVLMLAAERLDDQGEQTKALELLRLALEQEQDESELWRRYGQQLVKAGRLAEGVEAFEEALDIDPDNLAIIIAAGEASYRAGLLRPALAFYELADKLRSAQPDILAAIAAIHAALQDSERASDFGQRALKQSPHNLTAHIALARADLLSGDAEAALRRLTPILHKQTESRVIMLDVMAEALDALERTHEAFKAYEARNAILDEVYSPYIRQQLTERRVDQARRIASWLNSTGADSWPRSSESVRIARRRARICRWFSTIRDHPDRKMPGRTSKCCDPP